MRDDHRGAARTADPDSLDDDARRIGDLFSSFMDTETIADRGTRPIQPLLDAVEGLRDVRDLAAFLGEFERVGGSGLFGTYVDTDAKDSDRYLVNMLQGGLGLPDESYYRDDKFAEVREKYVAYLTAMFGLADHAEPAGRGRAVLEVETRLAAGHWERAETRDVQKTYNLRPAPSSRSCARRSTGTPGCATWAATRRRSPRSASGSRPTSRTSRRRWPRCRSRTGGRGC